jgi:DNA-directed RNA polymerase subunit M/transcription elongation factor TFIIS
MDQPATPGRTCPKCGSGEYAFRSRKTIEPDSGKDEPGAVETTYRCKACGKGWKVRVAAK